MTRFKKLSEVTKEDAIAILSASDIYRSFFDTGRWILEDTAGDLKEPSKKLSSKYKKFFFWFFDDCIDIENIETEIEIDITSSWFDVKFICYLKAFELGYIIPELEDFLKKQKP